MGGRELQKEIGALAFHPEQTHRETQTCLLGPWDSPKRSSLVKAPLLLGMGSSSSKKQGCEFLRLGNSWWVGMPQCLAAKECSPLSINLALQPSWRLAAQNYSLVLSDALLSSSCLLRGRTPTHKLLGRYGNSTTSVGTERHSHFIFRRYPLEKNRSCVSQMNPVQSPSIALMLMQRISSSETVSWKP